MDLAVFLFMGVLSLSLVGSIAFIGLSFHVDWTGYTPSDRKDLQNNSCFAIEAAISQNLGRLMGLL